MNRADSNGQDPRHEGGHAIAAVGIARVREADSWYDRPAEDSAYEDEEGICEITLLPCLEDGRGGHDGGELLGVFTFHRVERGVCEEAATKKKKRAEVCHER